MNVPNYSFFCNVDQIVGISNFCRDRNIVGCSKGFVKRIIVAAEEVVTPQKCRKYFVNMQRCTIFTILIKFAFSQPIFILIPATN